MFTVIPFRSHRKAPFMIEWGELLATLIFLETAGSGATFGEYPTQLYATANLSMGTENYVYAGQTMEVVE